MNGHGPKQALKTSYRASPRSLRPTYTGGPVLLTQDGRWLITTLGEEVLITEVTTGLSIGRIRGDSSAITSLALASHTSPPTLVTCHLSTTIRYYPLPSSSSSSLQPPLLSYSRQLSKAHSAPILVTAVSQDSALLAAGSSDGIVKVWDVEGGYVTHIFRGHGGPVSALCFHSRDDGTMELFTGSTDSKVRIYDLRDPSARGGVARPRAVVEGHVSVVRGIDISEDGRWAVTGGRDKVVLVWDLLAEEGKASKKAGKGKSGGPKLVQTVITQEQVEAVGLLPMEAGVGLRCFTGGDRGLVRIWDVMKGEEVAVMKGVEGVEEGEADEDEQRGVISVLYDSSSGSLVSVHADQNIIFHSLSTHQTTRQIVGFNDEIIDATFLSSPLSSSSTQTHLALATNSNLIRVYSTSAFDVRLLSGHQDMVLCLDKSMDHQWLVSGSKDQTARIWAPDDEQWRCIAICEGHAGSVGAVAMSRKGERRFLFTASQDRTIKMWDLTSVSSSSAEAGKPRSLATLRAHEKDINSLDLSPNDRFLASGSQDKLIKIFAVDFYTTNSGPSGSMKLEGTCKGHRRGVWSVKFSRTDRVVASGAADRTVRLWSLDDFTCLKTFEGHTNSVLRVDFLSQGTQLVTTSSDGLVKLWNIKDEACVKTLDNHEDKIWALAVSPDEKTIVSAGADSIATIWEDSTEAEQAEANDALVNEQDFTNYLALKDYRRAITLALAMSQPGRLLNLFTTVLSSFTTSTASCGHTNTTYTGSVEVDEVIRTLRSLDLVRLLKHVRDWNANARTSPVAQAILHAILRLKSPDEMLAAFDEAAKIPTLPETETETEDGPRKKVPQVMGLRELLIGLIPYSERHFARLDRLVQDSYVLDYVVGEMDGGMFGGEVMDLDGDR